MPAEYQPKPIPLITWRNMAPPTASHCFFKDSRGFPFETETDLFSLVNAWWLSEASLLAYSEEVTARTWFEKAGFHRVWFFSGRSTQCYVADARQWAVLAFRGTECRPDQGPEAWGQFIADLSADLDIRWVAAAGRGRIHRGFRDALDEVWPDVCACVEELIAGARTLWVTGHSLGGALALLAAVRINKVQGVYTFGAPRIGDREFAAVYPARAFRMVNNNDAVPHLPPFPYADLGELRYIDCAGTLHAEISRRARWMDEVQGHIRCLVENLRHLTRDPAATLPDGLKDHAPLLYALHLWNNLAQAVSLGPSP